jgi:hypothetical protein
MRRTGDGSDASDDTIGSTTSDALVSEGDTDLDDASGASSMDDGDSDDLGDNNGGCWACGGSRRSRPTG